MGKGLDDRMARLEDIVRALDSDELGLDTALALFEEGVGHLRAAREILTTAELRVEELIGDGDVGPLGSEDRDGPDRDGDGA